MDGSGSGTIGAPALVFRAGAHVCALALDHVAEVLRPLPAKPLAGVPAFVPGVCVLRGAAAPVIEVGALLGTRTAERTAARRFVHIRSGRPAALDVDEVIGIREIPLDLLHDLSSVYGTGVRAAVDAVTAVDAEPVVVLAATRIVPDSVWAALEDAS